MSAKKNKEKKPKARLPRGFVDRSASDIRATDEMIAKIREVYERYGFDPVETPMFEYTDCLGKFLPDTDRPNAGVFSVQDDDEQWMSLRYDMTAPLARHVAENINEIQMPFRTYRQGYVFRNEKPGPGRFRQFMQFDADSIGAPGVQADAEMCMMMADTMEALGIDKGDYVIRVNNRKLLDGVMDFAEIPSEKRIDVLRSLDKLDRLGAENVISLLTNGRKDESGDYAEGVGLSPQVAARFVDIVYGKIELQYQTLSSLNGAPLFEVSLQPTTTHCDSEILKLRDLRGNSIFREGLEELGALHDLLSKSGYSGLKFGGQIDRVVIDLSVVRGLEYYTGMVYEAELLFDVTNEKGENVQFGSVGGGGRYDGLIKRFTGRDVPGAGFSIGVSRLMTALKNLGKLGTSDVTAPVLVTVMDGDTEALGEYQKMVQQLRGEGIRAEMYQGNWKKFGNQLKYADRRGCPIAIIQGSDEREAGKIQVKDLIEGRKQADAIASNEEWRETRPGQFEIAASDLISEVKKLLAEQAKG